MIDTATPSSQTEPRPGPRQKRRQCDDGSPCLNCQSRGQQCSNINTTRASTLSQAHKEIDRLKLRVLELEKELQWERKDKPTHLRDLHQEPPPAASGTVLIRTQHNENTDGNTKILHIHGTQLRPARSPHAAWFGAPSLYSFIHRLSVFLKATSAENAQPYHTLLHSTTSAELLGQPTAKFQDASHLLVPPTGATKQGIYLNSVQEEYFINLFWQTYHTSLFAIIDEDVFKREYQALYVNVPSGQPRKASALVDIVVAICMQYGTSILPCGHQGNIVEDNDATISGRWHYRRAQTLLASEMESPTTSTLQCHLLSAIYVCGASFHNISDSICGLAVRTAYMLGLHIDPPLGQAEKERQMRRRLWWAVYVLDCKVGMKLGRPFLLNDAFIMPNLPDDQLGASVLSGSTFAPIADNATWLSFNLHQLKLFQTVRAAYNAFYSHDFGIHDGKKMWENASSLEKAASNLSPYIQTLEKWVQDVPDALKTSRKTQNSAFSTDGSALVIEQFAPLWLQRQRLLLELEYHHMCVNLYRPFVSFHSIPSRGGRAEAMMLKSVDHAIQLSIIIQQTLSSTPILDGWHEAFQWQWNAAMTLAGFILASPHCPSVPAARNAIELALSVFDTFGASFESGANAAAVVRILCSKIDTHAFLFGSESGSIPAAGLGDLRSSQEYALTEGIFSTGILDESIPDPQRENFDFLEMAVGVDFWADIDMLGLGDLGSLGEDFTQ
ncbi:hypothetical protein CT0861_12922 [Colletotrichum tofieldiae]|uniref:Xylanolytic transcriptional activator regulatory domain-containing protein n=1 Tax=Colletotrichum tofieldiae TaxID=708197 RepID=A0A166U3U9_9PEZI|nr:hypothetical protein CT0861_12922 [Colletotrichum tofieldiae]